jgi:hypothetical protein
MINEVSKTLPDPARDYFMANLIDIIRQPTLGRICHLARKTATSPSPQGARQSS